MKIKQLLPGIALATMAVSTIAQADQWSSIQAKGTLECGVYADVPPFSSPDPKTRQLGGMDVDLCDAIAKQLGVKAKETPLSVEARVPELARGTVDVIVANLAYTKTRAKQIEFSDPYYIAKEVLVTKAPLANNTPEFFKGKRLSSTKGSTSEQSIKLNGSIPITFQDTGSAYLAVVQNKSLGLVTNTMSANLLVSQAKESGISLGIVQTPLALEPIGVGVKKGEIELLNRINTALMNMEKEGEIDQIWEKWLGPNTKYNMKREDKVQKLSELKFEPLS